MNEHVWLQLLYQLGDFVLSQTIHVPTIQQELDTKLALKDLKRMVAVFNKVDTTGRGLINYKDVMEWMGPRNTFIQASIWFLHCFKLVATERKNQLKYVNASTTATVLFDLFISCFGPFAVPLAV